MISAKKAGQIAVEKAANAGATYVDIRLVTTESQSLSYSDGAPEDVSQSIDKGFGIRVIADGAWGFCSSADLTEKEITKTAIKAVRIAKASALLQKEPVILAKVKSYKDEYRTDIKVNPFDIPLKEKLDYLVHLDELMGKNEGINSRHCFLDFRKHLLGVWKIINIKTIFGEPA